MAQPRRWVHSVMSSWGPFRPTGPSPSLMKTYTIALFATCCLLQICGLLVLLRDPSSGEKTGRYEQVSSKAFQSLALQNDYVSSRNRTHFQVKLNVVIKEVPENVNGDEDVSEGNNHTDASCIEPANHGKVEDLMCWPRPNFDDSIKNPCWWEDSVTVHGYSPSRRGSRSLGKLQCLPYFHILCCSKSGTTDLFRRISQHGDIVPNSGIFGKEQLYWGWSKYGYIDRLRKGIPRTFASYIQGFSLLARRLSSAVFFKQSLTKRLVTLDASPPDMWDLRGWSLLPQNRGLREPAVLTPHLMRHLYRDPKFIVLMRDPVERMYSAYLFHHMGNSSRSFHRDVLSAIAMFGRCFRIASSPRECYFNASVTDPLPVELHFMCYSVYLKEWLTVFPRKHFLFMRTEDYKADVRSHVLKVFQFLQLSPPSAETLNKSVNMAVVYRTKERARAGDIWPETRALLRKYIEPCNTQLAHLLGDTKYLWADAVYG